MMKRIISRPISMPLFESYGMPSWTSMSANPMTPNPILRVWKVMSRIGSTAYWFASITLSSMWTEVRTVWPIRPQSI